MKEQIEQLIYLLDDKDEEFYQNVAFQLFRFGLDALPQITNALDSCENEVMEERLEYLHYQICYQACCNAIKVLGNQKETDLLRACFILSLLTFPELETETKKQRIKQIEQSIYFRLRLNHKPIEIIEEFNATFFSTYGFDISFENSPNHLLINHLLAHKSAHPDLVTTLYLIIAQALGLPMLGVKLHDHLVLAYIDPTHQATQNIRSNDINVDAKGVLFYVNVEENGQIFYTQDIKEYLDFFQIPDNTKYYKPCSNKQLFKFLIEEFAVTYEQKDKNKAEDIRTWIKQLSTV
ncbi:MAG: transglutaminase family protein [Chitinophagales bacterium]